jgi:hypothetical protein
VTGFDSTSGNVTVKFTGDDRAHTIKFTWTPASYSIKYYLNEAKTKYTTQTVYYDGSEAFITGKSSDAKVEAPTGYKFTGSWKLNENKSYASSSLVRSVQSDLFTAAGCVVELEPTFEYANLSLDTQTVTFDYKVEDESGVIKAVYGEGATTSDGSNFTYTFSNEGDLNDLGISISTVTGGFKLVTDDDGPVSTTGSAGFELKVTVADSAAKDADKASISVQTIKVVINQCPLNVKLPDGNDTVKTYDGNTKPPFYSAQGSITLETVYASGSKKGELADMQVTCNMSDIAYNSANVTEATYIEFDVGKSSMVAKSGSKENPTNYIIVGNTVPATIEAKDLWVIPSVIVPDRGNGKSYVRAGEADPEFTFALQDKSELVGDDTSWLDDIEALTNRKDLTTEGTYQITSFDASKSAVGSNYNLRCDINDAGAASFDVVMEEPVAGTNYSLNGTVGSDGWYYNPDSKEDNGISVSAMDGYTTVWVSEDGGKSYTKATSISELCSNNESVYIKLTSDESAGGTGAITKAVLLNLKYDGKAPQYKGYTVTMQTGENSETYTTGDDITTNGGLYFPGVGGVMSFGTYANKTIQIKIKYEDTVSGLNKLYYGLYGAKAEQSVLFDKSTGYATIEVVAEALNQDKVDRTITCYAEDVAGNTSDLIKLSPNDNDEYEWSVESVAPKIERFAVTGLLEETQTITVTSSREWYNHCEAELSVGDAVSGLRSITWHIIGDDEVTIPITYSEKKIITAADLTQSIDTDLYSSADASYTVYAVIEDNAGNEVETAKYSFKIDDVPPELVVDYDDNVWTKNETISFEVSDSLSGVDYAKVTDSEGNTIDCKLGKPDENGVYTASFEANAKGKYSVVVVDHAGNVNKWEQEIKMISNKTPDCPVISVSPATPDGLEDWYQSVPTVTITAAGPTDDNTPVSTMYQMWQEGDKAFNETTITGDQVERKITDDGVYNVKAWSVSRSGVTCEATEGDEKQIKVDSIAPEIKFDTSKGSGSSIVVNFVITDSGSGVNPETVKVLHGSQEMVAEVTEEAGVYTGSFEISETGNYTIVASDIAGNEAEAAAFTPMSMKVKAVTNISLNSATIGANVYKGTFDIASASISYRKVSEENYAEAQSVITKDDNGNAAVSAVLGDLTENTSYAFKITAVSAAPSDSSAGEVLEYEGYFKTLSDSTEGITVRGVARYSNTALNDGKITVGVFEGNECVQATEITAGDEFMFTNVPDGNYNIIATDGTYSKTMRLLIEDGVVVYPVKYIDLVLSGKNTSVVITTEDTPNVTVDDMDTIFELDTYNYTSDDALLVNDGGTVEFKLYATLMTVTSVSSDEISAMYAVTDKNKVVGAYLDLSLYKYVTDTDGAVERTRVTELAKGANVSVTIPLGDLAGKSGLEVVRIHDTGDRYVGSSLADMDSNPSTYTISTTQFSTYAVLYDPNPSTSSGNTTSGVTTSGSGTSSVAEGTASPSQSGALYAQAGTSQQNPDADDDDDDDDNSTGSSSTTPTTSSGSSVGSLRSSGTAKTGDATPIAVLGMMMIISLSGFVFIRRKIK